MMRMIIPIMIADSLKSFLLIRYIMIIVAKRSISDLKRINDPNIIPITIRVLKLILCEFNLYNCKRSATIPM